MAQQVLIHSGENGRATIRDPVGVLALTVVTLGLYLLYWWFEINRELAQLGRVRDRPDLGDNPGLSMAAFGLGQFLLLVPVVWTTVTTSRRIQRAQRLVGITEVLNGWLAALLWVFTLGIGGIAYTQIQMNKILSTQSPAPAPQPRAAPSEDTPIATAGNVEASSKRCPDCAEVVLAAARVCKHCGYRFAPAPESES